MQKVLCVIPARLNSSRLPRKMLAKIGPKALVLHTYASARKSKKITDFIVATDDQEIKALLDSENIPSVMSSKDIKTGSDRVAEVARSSDCSIIVNLQGDEPFIEGHVLDDLVSPLLADSSVQMTTAASPLIWETDYLSPDLVKVICDKKNDAIYFSRAPIPYLLKGKEEKEHLPVYKHMGLYAFRREFLLEYAQLPQTPLEKSESLEQLRALEHGIKIRVVTSQYRSVEVNNQKELEEARLYWRENSENQDH